MSFPDIWGVDQMKFLVKVLGTGHQFCAQEGIPVPLPAPDCLLLR